MSDATLILQLRSAIKRQTSRLQGLESSKSLFEEVQSRGYTDMDRPLTDIERQSANRQFAVDRMRIRLAKLEKIEISDPDDLEKIPNGGRILDGDMICVKINNAWFYPDGKAWEPTAFPVLLMSDVKNYRGGWNE